MSRKKGPWGDLLVMPSSNALLVEFGILKSLGLELLHLIEFQEVFLTGVLKIHVQFLNGPISSMLELYW